MRSSSVRYNFTFKKPVECVDSFIYTDSVITDQGLSHAKAILEREYFLNQNDYELISFEEIFLFGISKKANPKFNLSN